MAKIENKTKENPKLEQNKLSDGRTSLYLEYYLGREENLNLYLMDKPRTPAERQQNKETLELATKIRAEREQEFKESMLGYRLKKDCTINFLDYFQAYIDSYTKKDCAWCKLHLAVSKTS